MKTRPTASAGFGNIVFRKFIALSVLITFTATQTGWTSEPLAPEPGTQPTVEPSSVPLPPPDMPAEGFEATIDFLMGDHPLSNPVPQDGTLADSAITKAEPYANQDYEYERYDFKDALELLRPEFAVAVIVKNLTAENLKELTELSFETAVLVIHGEIVLVTSGSEDEIGVLPVARQLMEGASFMSHTHPGIYSAEGPSGQDMNEAVEAPREEYVITHRGAYAYNRDGLLEEGKTQEYGWYLSKLQEALSSPAGFSLNQHGEVRGPMKPSSSPNVLSGNDSSVAARQALNQFIAAQDAYNQAFEEERETFRRGGTLSYTSSLTSANVTTLPGSPYPYITTGSTPATSLSADANQFSLGYNVPGASDSSGFTVSFDNASTIAIETQNLSTQTYLTFGLKGPNTSVKLEIMDINGVKDTFTLTKVVNTAERFWRIPVSSILNTLDKTKIKQLQFIIAQANTASTKRTGTLNVRTSGLNVNAPEQPVVTSAIPAATNQTTLTVSGTKEANTSILMNGIEVVARDAATTWSATLNLPTEGNNVLSLTAKNSIAKVSTANSMTVLRDRVIPVGAIDINSGALYAVSAGVTLNLSASDTDSGMDKMSFSGDNVNWTELEDYTTAKAFTLPADEGDKTVYVKYYDKAGNVSIVYSKSILLDTTVPSGTFAINGGALYTNSRNITTTLSASDGGSGIDQIRFSVDGGQAWDAWENYGTSKALTLPAGDGAKEVRCEVRDKAGNIAAYVDTIRYIPSPDESTLQDGTKLFYQGGILTRELTPEGHAVFYAADGRVERWQKADGAQIIYEKEPPFRILRYGAEGTLLETLDRPAAPVLDETQAVKMTHEGGIEVYYRNGQPVEIRTAAGIRVTQFTLDAQKQLVDAMIVYPGGRREILRNGYFLRRIERDGTVLDFLPNRLPVREIFEDHLESFFFEKESQTQITRTRIANSLGVTTFYDEVGLMREVHRTLSEEVRAYFYDRTQTAAGYNLTLERMRSDAAEAKTLVAAEYDLEGRPVSYAFEDGAQVLFEAGKLAQATDASGNPIHYDDWQSQGYLEGLEVRRNAATLRYDAGGFLSQIQTAEGTIHRILKDTNGDGILTDQDTVDLLLETAGGDRLLDFELDSEGRILRGILETKEGIKQRIANGVLTGFETVDGKIYEMVDQEAILKEWHFRDGTRVLFGGGAVDEILLPDGKRLHTLGFNADREIETFVEEINGTKRYFEANRLRKIETPEGAAIHYGLDGLAERVILPDQTEQKVQYERNAAGEVRAIRFEAAHEQRTFTPGGRLTALLEQGVSAEIDVEKDQIKRLFTRFGAIETPQFNEAGAMSGEIAFEDGAKLIVQNGELIQAVRPNGTKVHYETGRIASVETTSGHYPIVYRQNADGKLTDLRIRMSTEADAAEYPLIPFLQNPDLIMAADTTEAPDHPVTFYGNAVIQEGSSRAGDAALKLDGSGDFVSVEHSPDFEFGTGDWTVDFWVKLDRQDAEYAIVNKGTHLNGGIMMNRHAGINRWDLMLAGNNILSVNTAMQTGQWHHVALVRNGAAIRFFQDGVQAGGLAVGAMNVNNQGTLFLGSNQGSIQFLPGQIDQLRMSRGARWTSNFAPPVEPVSADAVTKLLLDFEPPAPVAQASVLNVKELREILMPRELKNTLEDVKNVRSLFKPEEENAAGGGLNTFTQSGGVALNTADKKYGEGSLDFDGTSGNVKVAHSKAFEFGTESWTVDMWVQLEDQSREFFIMGKGTHTSGGFYFTRHAGINRWDIMTAGDNNMSVNTTMQTGQWHHIALVRDGQMLRFFQDGVQVGAVALRNDGAFTSTEMLQIGSQNNWGFFAGKIDELHFSKGVARWNSNFTPPAQATVRDEHTAMLLNFTQEEMAAGGEVIPPPPVDPNKKEDIRELFLARLVMDGQRGQSLEFAKDWFPEWMNVSLNQGDRDQGFLERSTRTGGSDTLPDLTSSLIDMDGDGLLDRVLAPGYADYWWVERNSGFGFENAMKWTGVNTSFQSFAIRETAQAHPIFYSDLVDMNGDGRPDRVLTQYNDPVWRVQLNNGSGFDAIREWGTAQTLSFFTLEGKYAIASRYHPHGSDIQDLQSTLMDLDGDGLPDRIVRPMPASPEGGPAEGQNPPDHWFFQKNTGTGFADAVIWEGVDWSFYPPEAGAVYDGDRRAIGASINWHHYSTGLFNMFADTGDLTDLNGDGLPDRVLMKHKNPADALSAYDWYVQFNNGEGFDPASLWDSDVRVLPGAPAPALATSIRLFDDISASRRYEIQLVDVTGDGLADRVSLDRHASGAQTSWWVEVNQYAEDEAGNVVSSGFAQAVEWTGIEGLDATETSLGQDNERYRLNRTMATDCSRVIPCEFQKRAELRDLNGDGFVDRILFRPGETRWVIQFGTGDGFLPAEEIEIVGLATRTKSVRSTRYDYLHASLKAAAAIPVEAGRVRVSLGNPDVPESYQEWFVENLTMAWQDFYLPMDPEKLNASEVRIQFVPAEGQEIDTAIYVDNITFTALRPPAMKAWADRMLADESVLAAIQDERTQTLAQYLGMREAETATDFNWDALLQAETRIQFEGMDSGTETAVTGCAPDESGTVPEGDCPQDGETSPAPRMTAFETLYGSVSQVEDGRITATVLPDGTRIEYDAAPAAGAVPSVTHQRTAADGTVENLQLTYGRVRSVSRGENQSALEYAYEFAGDTVAPEWGLTSLAAGTEITVVRDPATGVSERYAEFVIAGVKESRLLSRLQANGVLTAFAYNHLGELTESQILYKGRARSTFTYGKTEDGLTTLTTEDGTVEEYNAEGEIRFHTTSAGYRYAHSFEQARAVVTTMQTQTVNFPDGTAWSVEVPVVSLVEDPEGERVQRVMLGSYTTRDGRFVEYEGPELKSLKAQDGTLISFDRVQITEATDANGETVRGRHLADATVLHHDGTVTEFRDGHPFAITSATGRTQSLVTENGELIDPNESAAFHYGRAMRVWKEMVEPQWFEFQPPAELPVQIEYAMSGEMVTRQKIDGSIELYENGRIREIVGTDGERLVRYDYDEDGNPIRIEMEGTRRRLASAVLQLRAEVAMEREEALARIAEREQVINETVEGEYRVARENLLAIRRQIEAEQGRVATIAVKGKEARNLIGSAITEIQVGLDQVNAALAQLAEQHIEALEQLATQVAVVSQDIEIQTTQAYLDIEAQNRKIRQHILRQEITPVVYHWYRKILGRDPSQAEYDAIIANTDYETGIFNLETLKQSLENSAEFEARSSQVQAIKDRVAQDLEAFLAMDAAAQAAFAADLGIESAHRVTLSQPEVASILQWLLSRSLHFGQSAFLALEALLPQGLSPDGTVPNRVALARRLILIDILTGIISPLEQGDLVISAYAMKRVGAHYGLAAHNLGVSYEGLLRDYETVCGSESETCDYRAVALINGNHYVILNRVTETEVVFTDPGAGAEGSLAVVTLSREEFIKVWEQPIPGLPAGYGYLLAPRAPPESAAGEYVFLTDQETMRIRGAFFGFFAKIFKKIGEFIWAGIKAVVQGVVALVKGVVQALVTFVKGLGNFFAGLFTFDFSRAFKGLNQIFVQSTLEALGGILEFVVSPVNAFADQLQVLGVSERTAERIKEAVISGGKIVIGVGLIVFSAGNPVAIGAGVSLIGSGASELLSRHTNLSPSVIRAISIGAQVVGVVVGGGLGGGDLSSGLSLLKGALPSLAPELASAGLVSVGDALGLDPRIQMGLNMVTRAAVGFAAGKLAGDVGGFYTDSQGNLQKIIISNSSNTGLTFAETIRNTLFSSDLVGGAVSLGAQSIGFNFGSVGSSLLGSLSSASITSAIGSMLGQEGLFSNILGVVKDALLSPVSLVGGVVKTALNGVTEFNALIQEKGIGGAFESLAASIFSRQTIETLLGSGGVGGVLGTAEKVLTTLDGQSVQEQNLGGGTSLFYDLAGAFIGKKENGVTQVGTFGQTTLGKWGLLAGSVLANLAGGLVFAGEVQNGQLVRGTISGPSGVVAEIRPEGNSPYIIIDGSEALAKNNNSGGFWNAVVKFLPLAIDYIVREGKAVALNISNAVQQGAAAAASVINKVTHNLFGNGFNNTVAREGTYDGLIPPYVRDLSELGDKVIKLAESLLVPMYETTNLFSNALSWSTDFLLNLENESWLQNLMNAGLNAIAPFPLFGAANIFVQIGLGLVNNLAFEAWAKMLALESQMGRIDKGIAFAHSGFFAPLTGALAKKRPDDTYFDVNTIINYEGVHPGFKGEGFIDNPNLKTIINVWGTAPNDPFTNGQHNGETCLNGHPCMDYTKKEVPVGDFGPPAWVFDKANFTSSHPLGLTNINIEIKDARHNDFTFKPEDWNDDPYEPERKAREINRLTNLFMRQLYDRVVEDQKQPGLLIAFLEDMVAQGKAKYENGIWRVDFGDV